MRHNLTLKPLMKIHLLFYHSNHVKMKHKQHLSIKEVITCKSCPEDSKPFLFSRWILLTYIQSQNHMQHGTPAAARHVNH